ncbi:MAG: SIS domain-containing protein [Halobacteriovoraceae bacterium]|jgi:D-sedoheptulose 7-phosphate isomerase|nr:SIS domain-containing protein [Halobacteriovoraceae bacterium]
MNSKYITQALFESQETLSKFISNPNNIVSIEKAVTSFVTTIKDDGRIMACGNGGSMCDSMHFVEELTGRYRKDRDPICAIPMGDAGHLTCVANDYGFDQIFSRNVQAWGRKGDTLLAISTSGNSQNIINAVKVAKEKEMHVIGLLGKNGGLLKEMVDIPLIVDAMFTDRIQEIHIKLIHIFIEGIERQLYPDHYTE